MKKEKIAGGEARGREKIAAGEADGREKRRDGGCAPRAVEKNFGLDHSFLYPINTVV
jgi:hypothetical protein